MPFIILALMVVALAAVSFLPDAERIYTSPVFVAGWAVLAAWSLCVIVRRRLYVRPAVFMLHVSFLVILAGALVTHCCGTSEKVHLRVGDTVFVGALPVTLDEFVVEYYPGTQAPSDFVSHITVDGTKETVAMNKVVTADGYRFYQSGYDADSLGSVLTVTHDPWGIGVTYSGYLMLLVSMIWICVPEKRRKTVAAVVAVIGFCSPALNAAPSVVPADVAERFGNLFVYHNGRVAPFSSLARDFTVRLTGSATYRGMNPEQVLSGWLFYYDSWKDEPCIYIKGVASDGGDRASLADFLMRVAVIAFRIWAMRRKMRNSRWRQWRRPDRSGKYFLIQDRGIWYGIRLWTICLMRWTWIHGAWPGIVSAMWRSWWPSATGRAWPGLWTR